MKTSKWCGVAVLLILISCIQVGAVQAGKAPPRPVTIAKAPTTTKPATAPHAPPKAHVKPRVHIEAHIKPPVHKDAKVTVTRPQPHHPHPPHHLAANVVSSTAQPTPVPTQATSKHLPKKHHHAISRPVAAHHAAIRRVAIGTRYQTGQNCIDSGRYRFDGYIDGTNVPAPKPQEMQTVFTKGSVFPAIRSANKGCWWRLAQHI
jgi:hypothetical protein